MPDPSGIAKGLVDEAIDRWGVTQADGTKKLPGEIDMAASDMADRRLAIELARHLAPFIDPEKLTVQDYEECMDDWRRLTRELDVALNGDGAAKQASLCDILAQAKHPQLGFVRRNQVEDLLRRALDVATGAGRPSSTDCVEGGGPLMVSNGKRMFMIDASVFTKAADLRDELRALLEKPARV